MHWLDVRQTNCAMSFGSEYDLTTLSLHTAILIKQRPVFVISRTAPSSLSVSSASRGRLKIYSLQ